MGSEISREEIAEALMQRPRLRVRAAYHLDAHGLRQRLGRAVGGLLHLVRPHGAQPVGAIACVGRPAWEQREVGDGFVAAVPRRAARPASGRAGARLETALAQFHRVTRMFRHRLDLNGWAAWVACVLNPSVPEGEVVAALEVIAATDPSKVHWANAALLDWTRLSSYAAADRARVVAFHRDAPHRRARRHLRPQRRQRPAPPRRGRHLAAHPRRRVISGT